MSQQQRNLDPIVHSWPICETFSRSLCSKFIEGTSFSLLFSYENDRVVFRWNDGKVKGTSKTPEINFVVTLRIDGGESGEILLDESWEISNLRCKSAVDLIYSAKVTEPWLNWTNVRIEIHDVTPIGHSGKEAVSRGIVYREIQRPASISAATNDMAKVESGKQSDPIKSVVEAKRIRSTSARVDLKTSPSSSGSDSIPIETSQPKAHNGKQSDPFKPVAKPQQTQSTEGRIALKSPLSTVGSEPIGPPPMKRQKTDESSAAAVNNGDSSTVAAVNVPSLPAKLFPDGYRREAANDVRLIQALTAKIAQLTEDNGRLTSTLSRMQMKLANAEDEAKSNMAEKTAELNQSQLNCERLESECKTQMRKELELVKSHQSELEQGKVKLDKLTSDLCNLQQLNDRNLEEIEDKTKMEENLSAQLVELKKFCEREIKVVNFDTLIFSIRLANQLRSDLLMAECFTFVKQERAKEQMWEDLHSHLQLPKILAQISVFSGSDSINMRRSQQPKQFGKQSDPVKPVVKPQQIESTEAQVAPKSLQSGVDSRSNGQPPAKRQKIVQSSTDSIAVDAAKSVAPVAVVTPSLPIPIVSDHSDRTKNHTEADCDVTSIYVTRGTENGYRWDVWELVNRTAEVFAGKVSTDSPGAELECFCLKPNGHGKFSFWFKSVAKGVEISFTIGVHTRNQNDQKGKSFWWKVEHLGQNVVDLNFPCCDDKSCQIGCETNWTRRVCISNLRLTTKTDQKSVEFVKVSRCQDTSEAADAAVTTQQSVKKSDTIQPVIKPEQIQSVEGRDGLRPTSSAVSSGSVGQQPVKQQKMTQSPATVVNLGVNSAAAVVAVSAPPSKLFSGDTRDGAQMVKAETRLSQLEEENLRVTSTLSKMRLTLAEAGKDVAEAESKLSDNTAELLTQLRSNYGQLKLEYKSQVDLAVQLRTQMQLLSETIEKRSKVEENLTSEINRQSIIIDQKSKVEEHHRVQLREKTEEVQRLNGTINQMKIDKAREENQNNRRLGRNVPPYHGWTTDFPDFILISSDDITFPVCRGVLSLKSAVFKADFSTDAAKKDGQVKTAFKADVMLELLKFLCGQDFTENLAVVAVELMRAAEHYQLAELTEVCEEQLVEQLTFDTLIFTIRLADQLSSDLLMAECFKFVKREKGSEKMWEDLHLHLQLPKMMAQITVFSGTGKNAKCPKFHFSP